MIKINGVNTINKIKIEEAFHNWIDEIRMCSYYNESSNLFDIVLSDAVPVAIKYYNSCNDITIDIGCRRVYLQSGEFINVEVG